MIQRIQTLYCLVAVIASIVSGVYLIMAPHDDGVWRSWMDVAVIVLSVIIGVTAIFTYGNRKRQARMCAFNTLLSCGWVIAIGAASLAWRRWSGTPIEVATACINILFYTLARRAILKDEELIRSADRIR